VCILLPISVPKRILPFARSASIGGTLERETRKTKSRDRILIAAEAVFGEMGYEAASVEVIAQRANVTRKTVYNQFASKEDVAEQLLARNEALVEPLYRDRIRSGEAAIALLENILLDSAGWCVANPNLALMALAPAKRPNLEPPEGRPSFQGIVRDTILLGQVQGTIRRDEDAEFLSMILLGIYAQAMITVIAGFPYDPAQIKRIIRILIEGAGSPRPSSAFDDPSSPGSANSEHNQ
jgi:AcrR family transcriptional regulator